MLTMNIGYFKHINTDGAKKPWTVVTGFGVAAPEKGIGISRRTTDRLGVRGNEKAD